MQTTKVKLVEVGLVNRTGGRASIWRGVFEDAAKCEDGEGIAVSVPEGKTLDGMISSMNSLKKTLPVTLGRFSVRRTNDGRAVVCRFVEPPGLFTPPADPAERAGGKRRHGRSGNSK